MVRRRRNFGYLRDEEGMNFPMAVGAWWVILTLRALPFLLAAVACFLVRAVIGVKSLEVAGLSLLTIWLLLAILSVPWVLAGDLVAAVRGPSRSGIRWSRGLPYLRLVWRLARGLHGCSD